MIRVLAQGGDPLGRRPCARFLIMAPSASRPQTNGERGEGHPPLSLRTEGVGFDFPQFIAVANSIRHTGHNDGGSLRYSLCITPLALFFCVRDGNPQGQDNSLTVGLVRSMTARPAGNARHIAEILTSMGYMK